MAAPLRQEREYKRQLDQDRLAALRGDDFVLPRNEYLDEGAANNGFFLENPPDVPANNTQFFAADSEDRLLTSLSRSLPSTLPVAEENSIPDPADFPFLQQQARMAQGIGSPDLLPPEVAALPDPEYSTEEEIVTYGESVDVLTQQAREAKSSDVVQRLKGQTRQKIREAFDKAGEQLENWLKEQANRLLAKAIGNGGNALDSVGWDMFVVYGVTYLYLMARGFVSILAPESDKEDDDIEAYVAKKGLYILLPPYRPLREPGDFLWFLTALFITFFLLILIVTAFVLLMTFSTFPTVLFGLNPS